MPGLMAVEQHAPMLNPYALGHVVPPKEIDAPTFFVRLLTSLDFDFPKAAVLYALLSEQADRGFVKASKRDLSAALGCSPSDRHVWRALIALEGLGLIESKTHPNTTTRYRVLVPALRDLLATPLSEADVIPGLRPLPALDRMCADDEATPLANSSSAFFVGLFHALEFDFPKTAVFYALLARNADLHFVGASKRDLSAALGCCVSDQHVWRSLRDLQALGLIESKTHPNTTTRYRVLVPALRDLLATPLSEADVIPGLTPLPALDRMFADAGVRPTLDTLEEGNHHA